MSKGNIRSGGFDLNGLWSPWYTLHKTYAGLRDAYRYTGNRTALDVEIKYAEWAERVLAPLDDAQTQRMLNTEFGGMNEVLADLYADTGDRRWLDALAPVRSPRGARSARAREDDRCTACTATPTCPSCSASAGPLHLHRRLVRRLRPRPSSGIASRPPSHVCDRRPRQGRVLPRSGQAERHHRRPHGRDLQRLQHAQAHAGGSSRCGPTSEYAEFHERALFNHILGSMDPQRRQHVLHGAGRAGRAARIPGHVPQLHLLRRIGHGEPRAARLRALLRVAPIGCG